MTVKNAKVPIEQVLPVRVETRLKSSELLDLDKFRKQAGVSRRDALRTAWLSFADSLKQEGQL